MTENGDGGGTVPSAAGDQNAVSIAHPLEMPIEKALRKFLSYIRVYEWRGRENEAVSFYAFGFLQEECAPGTTLSKPAQIGIEVGVVESKKSSRSQTRKDLVIWAEPGMNRWYPSVPRPEPMAIVEWKVRREVRGSGSSNAKDLEFLRRYCASHVRAVGYSVWLLLDTQPEQLHVWRFRGGREDRVMCE